MMAQSAAPDAAQEERRVRTAKTIVLSLACVVGLSLVTAFVFGVYNFVTDRPAKEMFQGR
ncbi:MAG: hypothetical protein ACHQ53_10290 [Polyangiales bacterium]